MTDQSIGTARLDIVVDTTNLESGVERAKKAQDGLSQSSTRATQTQEQNSKRQIASLEKQIATLGKSREEIVRWRIETQTAGDVQKRLLANFDATTAKLNAGAVAFNRYGVSAKQQAAALRGVPAQLNDIVVSLGSGQRPLQVLLQQGGQLQTMFGGIAPAFRAVGAAALNLINPFTLAAAAVVGIAVAFNKVSEEQAAFTKALVLSGNVANVTTQQLEDMASALDDTTSATGGRARDTLAQVAVSGKFTAEQMQLVAQAAINMEDATGQAVSKTVEQFARLEDDPVKAILKLNGAINDGTNVTNFLTRAQIDAIEKFEEQGKSAEAAKVAIEAYAAAINDRAPEITKNLGFFASIWREIKVESGDALNVVLNGFRKVDEEAKRLSQNSSFRALVAGVAPVLPGGFTLANAVNNAGKPPEPTFIGFKPGAKPVNSRDEEARIAAEEEFERLAQGNLSKREKLESEIAEIRKLGVKAGKSELEIQAQINNARKRYQESLPKGAKGTSLEAASSRAAIQAFEDQLRKEQGLIANQTKVLEANYSARNVTVEHYYAEQKRLAQENSAAQVTALEGEIAALQSRSLKGKDSINNARELAEKEALLAKVRADGATALEVLNIQEAAQIKQRQQANIAYADALTQGRDALKAELDSQVLRITVGEREFEIRSRIIQLYRDEAKELLNLARQRDAGEIDPETYKTRVEQLRVAIAAEVKIVRDGYDQMAEAQKNWANGALKAFADYNDAANDVAGQTYTIFSDAIGGLEDVFVDFFTKGKADWKGFFDDIAAEITRFVVRQQLNKLIQKFIPGMDKEGGDNAQALSSAAASLAASAAPLYGAAAALSASAAALAAAGVGEAASGDSGSAPTGSGWGSWFQIAASIFANAKGNAFAGGNVTAFADGGVFHQPTMFGMGGGRLGVMGEAGPEAVMPLKRGPDGKLGVQASGAARVPVSVTVNQVIQGRMDRQTAKRASAEMGKDARREMARTG